MKTQTLSPEIQAAIDVLYAGAPLGEVVAKLTEINYAAALESYASGMSLLDCGEKHGIKLATMHRFVQRIAPHLMRPAHIKYRRKNRQEASAS